MRKPEIYILSKRNTDFYFSSSQNSSRTAKTATQYSAVKTRKATRRTIAEILSRFQAGGEGGVAGGGGEASLGLGDTNRWKWN